MKKGISIILVAVLCLLLNGCSNQEAITESIVESVKESVLASISESSSLRASEEAMATTEATLPETVPETTPEPTTTVTETTMDPAARKEYLRSSVITIESIIISEPNSAGGVDVSFTVKNQAAEEIKYVDLTLNFYNRVGDIVSSDIGFDKTFLLSLTGPIAPGDKGGTEVDDMYWPNVIYNSNATKILITEIRIEYMDGESLTLTSEEAQMVLPEA